MRTVGAVLVALVLASGCESEGEGMGKDEQVAELMQRPDIDEISRKYEQMRTEVADKLTQELAIPPWDIVDGRSSEAGCGSEFPDLGLEGRIRSLDTLATKASTPDDKWERAVEITASVVGKNGFGPGKPIVDRHGQHTVEFTDNYGGRLVFATQVHTILSIRTGCHLTAEAHERGTAQAWGAGSNVESTAVAQGEPVIESRATPETSEQAPPSRHPRADIEDVEDFDQTDWTDDA